MTEPFYVAFVGSRDWDDPGEARRMVETRVALEEVNTDRAKWHVVVVTGGAPGVDRWAEEKARSLGLAALVIRPDYERYARGAPLKRNEEIVAKAHKVIAMWNGVSAGTGHTIQHALRTKTWVEVFFP